MKAYVTIGVPGSGKSTWAAKQPALEINLDECREQVCGNAADQSATPAAVALRDKLIREAAENEQDIVLSDTNLNHQFRLLMVGYLLRLGYDVCYVVFDVSARQAKAWNQLRDRVVPEHVIDRMHQQMRVVDFALEAENCDIECITISKENKNA